MTLFELTHPDYSTDQEDFKYNPVEVINGTFLPGVFCDICGSQWASSDRIRVPSSTEEKIKNYLRENSFPRFVPISRWNDIKNDISNILNDFMNLDYVDISPGAEIGVPRGEILKDKLEDFIHPFPGQIWVSGKVYCFLKEQDLTGFNLIKVESRWSKKLNKKSVPPELWEIDVKGKAWRIGMDLDKITDCRKCRRTVFPNPGWLKVDQSRWDGTDFFNVDLNPNIILVTKKVCSILKNQGFSNFQCVEV